jgi:hypothetical protein
MLDREARVEKINLQTTIELKGLKKRFITELKTGLVIYQKKPRKMEKKKPFVTRVIDFIKKYSQINN